MKFSGQKHGLFPRCLKNFVQNFQSCCLLKFSEKSVLHIVGIVLLGTMMDSDQRICILLSVLATLWREYLTIITITSTPFYLVSKMFWSRTHSYSHMREVAGTEAIIFPHAIIFPAHHVEKLRSCVYIDEKISHIGSHASKPRWHVRDMCANIFFCSPNESKAKLEFRSELQLSIKLTVAHNDLW